MADERYRVLARKWRPATFSEVVGQEHVTRSLANALRQNRIHHAYLLCGPRGVGKTTIARILAKALNCAEGPTDTPCLKCPSCLGVASGVSMDVMEIDGASNNSVEQVRDLRETIGYSPAEGRYRVIIIDEVHMLSKAAFNALLKTLEEPPSHVVFIFATTEATKVLPTVQSRCQRYDFHRLTVAEIRRQIAAINEAEGFGIEAGGLDLIAVKADGALRDAESLLDQVAAATSGSASAAEVADLIGAVERTVYLALVDAIAAHDPVAALASVAETIDRGRGLGEFLTGLLFHLRHLLACRVGAAVALADIEESDRKALTAQAEKFSERDILRMLNVAAETESALGESSAPQVRVELALLKMVYQEPTVELADLVARLEELGGDGGGSGAPALRPAAPPADDEPSEQRPARATHSPPPARPAPARPQVDDGPSEPPDTPARAASRGPVAVATRTSPAVVMARWPEITAALKEEGVAPAWLDSQVEVAGFDEGVLRLVVKEKFYIERLKKLAEQMLGVVRQRFPDVRRLDIAAREQTEQVATGEAPPRRRDSIVQGVVEEEPIVGKLIDTLGLELQ